MKSLVIALSLVVASPVFAANCVSEMLAGPAQGNLEKAQELCRKSEKVCNLSEIIAQNAGMNYSQAMELCARNLVSNAQVINCIAQGNNYATCQQ